MVTLVVRAKLLLGPPFFCYKYNENTYDKKKTSREQDEV